MIYSCKEGEGKLPLGSYLGGLTNKLRGGEWIKRFCSTGSKCYSFQTNLNREVVHVKGFLLKEKGYSREILFQKFRNSRKR